MDQKDKKCKPCQGGFNRPVKTIEERADNFVKMIATNWKTNQMFIDYLKRNVRDLLKAEQKITRHVCAENVKKLYTFGLNDSRGIDYISKAEAVNKIKTTKST